MLTEHNELLRSAHEIARRDGHETNWEAFKNNVERWLMADAGMLGTVDEQQILRATCTPKTYRLRDEVAATDACVLEELKAIIAKLPKTGDGIPIVPGLTVFVVRGNKIDERDVVGPYGNLALLVREPEQHGAASGTAHCLAETVFSTREAALVETARFGRGVCEP